MKRWLMGASGVLMLLVLVALFVPVRHHERGGHERWAIGALRAINSVVHEEYIVTLPGDEMRTEFVCIPRPITRSDRPDGGPLRYRVVHTASLWKPGERPVLRHQVLEGDPGLSI